MNKYFNYNLSTHSNTISIDETININTIVLFTLLKIYIKYAEYIFIYKKCDIYVCFDENFFCIIIIICRSLYQQFKVSI